MDITVNKKGGAQVEITGEIPAETFAEYRPQALKNVGKDVEVAGFRKGNVPEHILAEKVGEQTILGEMAEIALQKAYPAIIKEHGINAIGRPEVTITKLAKENSLGFTIHVATMPDITLADYKDVARDEYKTQESVSVSNEELEEAIADIRRRRAEHPKQEPLENQAQQSVQNTGPQLPELNDEFVRSLGNFKDVADFKEKFREGIRMEKEKQAKDKKRSTVIDRIIKKSTFEIPAILVEGEIDRLMQQFEGQVAQAGGTIDDYLKQTGKTRDEMRKDWRTDAEKRVKAQLVLNKIASRESLTPSPEAIAQQTEQVKQLHADVGKDQIRAYIETVLTNEEVFKFLESFGSEVAKEEDASKDTEASA